MAHIEVLEQENTNLKRPVMATCIYCLLKHQLQSSTWSNYKQHNTFYYLVGVTPNGAILPIFVGSISDLLSELEGKCIL